MALDQCTIITGPQGGGNPSSGNSFQAPEPPKLKLRLTPKAPAAQGRGYMTYDYPNSVRLTDTQNSVLFSKYNMAGGLRFSAKLEAGKTYLIAIEVAPDNGSGGHLQLYIGGQTSTHQLGSWNDVTVISRVVTPQKRLGFRPADGRRRPGYRLFGSLCGRRNRDGPSASLLPSARATARAGLPYGLP